MTAKAAMRASAEGSATANTASLIKILNKSSLDDLVIQSLTLHLHNICMISFMDGCRFGIQQAQNHIHKELEKDEI